MIRRITASVVALFAAVAIAAPSAQAAEAPRARHVHSIVKPDPAPSLARHIDWD